MAEETATASSTGGAAPRFEIKKWNAVAMWSWDICADSVCYYDNTLFTMIHLVSN
jgi:RING-box protein 1